MKLEVDFPTTGLPEDRELVGVEMRKPRQAEYYFSGNLWVRAAFSFHESSYFIAVLKSKEVWLPCTPEDAFAKMLHPESRVIRNTSSKTRVIKVTEITDISMGFYLEGYPFGDGPRCPFHHFEVLKTKELS